MSVQWRRMASVCVVACGKCLCSGVWQVSVQWRVASVCVVAACGKCLCSGSVRPVSEWRRVASVRVASCGKKHNHFILPPTKCVLICIS